MTTDADRAAAEAIFDARHRDERANALILKGARDAKGWRKRIAELERNEEIGLRQMEVRGERIAELERELYATAEIVTVKERALVLANEASDKRDAEVERLRERVEMGIPASKVRLALTLRLALAKDMRERAAVYCEENYETGLTESDLARGIRALPIEEPNDG